MPRGKKKKRKKKFWKAKKWNFKTCTAHILVQIEILKNETAEF
jgi:hypothetical protein